MAFMLADALKPESSTGCCDCAATSAACAGAQAHAAPDVVGSRHPVCVVIDRADEVSCAALVVRHVGDGDLAVVQREPR
jgi:hypothetical protein